MCEQASNDIGATMRRRALGGYGVKVCWRDSLLYAIGILGVSK